MVESIQHKFNYVLVQLTDSFRAANERQRNEFQRLLWAAFPAITRIKPRSGKFDLEIWTFKNGLEGLTAESINLALAAVNRDVVDRIVSDPARALVLLVSLHHPANMFDFLRLRAVKGVHNAEIAKDPVYGGRLLEVFVSKCDAEMEKAIRTGLRFEL